MGGRIDIVVDPFLSVIPYVKAGKMKMIATLGDKRVPGYDYPIAAETVAGFAVEGLLGFVAPAGTPKPVVAKIQADTAKVLAVPETRQRIADLGNGGGHHPSRAIRGDDPERDEALVACHQRSQDRSGVTLRCRCNSNPLHPVFVAEASGIDLTRAARAGRRARDQCRDEPARCARLARSAAQPRSNRSTSRRRSGRSTSA
jgi:hypothetical protein